MTLSNTKNPLVSVVVTVYNDAPYLDRTMLGLMNQSYYNLEIIMIDDGSTDHGLAIMQYYAAQDSRIRIISKQNTGVSSSRNVGIEHASGTWIYFADADDWMARDCIERLVAATHEISDGASSEDSDEVASEGANEGSGEAISGVSNEGSDGASNKGTDEDFGEGSNGNSNEAPNDPCDLVISSFYRVHGMNAALKESPSEGQMSREQFVRFMRQRPANLYYASLWNKLFRRDLLQEHNLRLDTSVNFGEDHIFILEYLHFVRNVSMLKEGLYYYVDNQDSLLHQGLNFPGVVRMKWDTIKPYCRLFKKIGFYKTPIQIGRAWLFGFAVSTDYFVYEGARQLTESEVPDHILPASGDERDSRVKIWQQENDLHNIKEKVEALRLAGKLKLDITYLDDFAAAAESGGADNALISDISNDEHHGGADHHSNGEHHSNDELLN